MKDKENPFAHKPSGNVRFLDAEPLDGRAVTPKSMPTGFAPLTEMLGLDSVESGALAQITPIPLHWEGRTEANLKEYRTINALHDHNVVQVRLTSKLKDAIDSSLDHMVWYTRGQWIIRNVRGTFEQVWNAPPTWKQVRNARRMIYAQLRLEKQLAETMAQIEEQRLNEMADALGIDRSLLD